MKSDRNYRQLLSYKLKQFLMDTLTELQSMQYGRLDHRMQVKMWRDDDYWRVESSSLLKTCRYFSSLPIKTFNNPFYSVSLTSLLQSP